jgi:hypothetical protein
MLELPQTVSSLRAVLPSCPGRHECIDSRYFVIGRAKRLLLQPKALTSGNRCP